MIEIRRITTIFVLVFCAFQLSSCQSDETKFNNDAVAVAELRKIAQRMESGTVPTNEEFKFMRTQFTNYPESPTVISYYEKALLIREDFGTLAQFYEALGTDIDVDQKRNLAKVYVKLGRFEEAYEATKSFDFKVEKEMRLVAAKSLFQLGRYDEAKKVIQDSWDNIVSEKSTDEMAIRGMIYFHEGDSSSAIQTLTSVLALEPHNVPANNGLSRIYKALGEDEKAAAAQNRVQQIFDKVTASEALRTQNVAKGHKLQEAYKAKRYDEVIALARELESGVDSQNRKVLFEYLYNSYMALGKQEEARKVLEEAKRYSSQ